MKPRGEASTLTTVLTFSNNISLECVAGAASANKNHPGVGGGGCGWGSEDAFGGQ